jgi:hypothetical protein
MFLTGSMGLASLVRSNGLNDGNFNDLKGRNAPHEFSRREAAAMFDALASGHGAAYASAVRDVVLDHSGALFPSFVNYAFGSCLDAKARDAAAVEALFANEIRPNLDATFHREFTARLGRLPAEDARHAKAILRQVRRADGRSVSVADISVAVPLADDGLVDALVEDGLLHYDTATGTIRPASRLVSTWLATKSWAR